MFVTDELVRDECPRTAQWFGDCRIAGREPLPDLGNAAALRRRELRFCANCIRKAAV